MCQNTSGRLSPRQLLEFQYSNTLYCGIDEQGNDVYQDVDTAPSECLPSVDELTKLSIDELIKLARRIARAYKFYLLSANIEEKTYVAQDLPFGINIKKTKITTIESMALRLSDEKWWRRKIFKLADEKREHRAHLNKELGGKNPSQTCCTNRTIEMFDERAKRTEKFLKESHRAIRSESDVFVFNLLDIAKSSKNNRLNELFLNIKALEKIAERKDFGCLFLTLTAAPEFHPNPKAGKNGYKGATAGEANKSIQKDWRSILDSLDNLGIKRDSGEYFGFRVVEVHDDGCPHWHVVIFANRNLGVFESIQNSIERLYQTRGNYFKNNISDIIRVIEKTDEKSAAPSSYIFGYVLKALGNEDNETAKKYKCAIRAMGARQYAFFGIKCSTGKQRALQKIARKDEAPTHIKKQANELHLPKDAEDRNRRQLEARIEFFEHGSEELVLEKERKTNRYGEEFYITNAIRHVGDDTAVQIKGLSESISSEQAEMLRRSEKEGEKQVTIIVNYSRRASKHEASQSSDSRIIVENALAPLSTLLTAENNGVKESLGRPRLYRGTPPARI